jgi:hypothetical protein
MLEITTSMLADTHSIHYDATFRLPYTILLSKASYSLTTPCLHVPPKRNPAVMPCIVAWHQRDQAGCPSMSSGLAGPICAVTTLHIHLRGLQRTLQSELTPRTMCTMDHTAARQPHCIQLHKRNQACLVFRCNQAPPRRQARHPCPHAHWRAAQMVRI